MALSFKQAVKVICSEWDCDMTLCADYKGNHYERYCITNTANFKPTYADCYSLANYLGMRYHKGYFYNKLEG